MLIQARDDKVQSVQSAYRSELEPDKKVTEEDWHHD